MLAKLFKLTAIAIFTLIIISGAHAEAKQEIKLDVPTLMKERKIGSDDAPVKIVKYASFTCGHCATLETKTMPQIKKDFVDTGIAQIIYKPFPLDDHALQASLMMRCIPEENFFETYETLFSQQKEWFQSGNPTKFLVSLADLAGLNREQFVACTNNQELIAAVKDEMIATHKKHKIEAVPAMIFNEGEQIVVGYQTYEQLAKIIKDVKTITELKKTK